MDVRFINPFIKSISNIFTTMLSSEVDFQKPFVKSATAQKPDVSAIIGFSGDASGAVVLCFQKATAVKIASTFACTELTIESPDFADALGEIANMVAGGAKAEFQGIEVNISLPSVIVGTGHEVVKSNAHPSLVLPCQSPFGGFTVEVSMEVKKQAAVGAAS